jgi:archaellin
MIKISLRYKIVLELYASLSLFAAIIILLYYSLSDMIGEDLYIPAVGIIGFFLIAFIFFLRTLILDVSSIKFENDSSKDDPNIVEIKVINKVTLELISSISNIIILAAIFIFGIEKSGGADSGVISIAFIIIILLPLIILLKSLFFDFNLIFMDRNHRENFLNEFINGKTIFFIAIAIIILTLLFASNKLNTSVGNLYGKSMSTGEETLSDLSENIYITSISGERNVIPGAPITELNIYVEAKDFDFNVNYITILYINQINTSTLKYGITADESHFYYEGKTTGKGNTKLRKYDVGIITINLSSTKQELYSYKSGTIQLILGNGKTISRNIKAPQLLEDSRIQLYPRS